MLYEYIYLDDSDTERTGTIEAASRDGAIRALQEKGYQIVSVSGDDGGQSSLLGMEFDWFSGVSNRDLVIVSRQIATLFNAQLSALRVFQLLAEETDNDTLREAMYGITRSLKGGSSMSEAFAQHPNVFSPFYVNMVKAGEEAGRLDDVFAYLANYLERNYEITRKTRNALIYPAFVIVTFIGVMALMLTVVIPRLTEVITQSGEEIPIYTQIVVFVSDSLVNYGPFLLILLAIAGFFLWRYTLTQKGQYMLDRIKISIPYIGTLYRKLYLARIADNMNTMLSSGIAAVRALDITAETVGNHVYRDLLTEATEAVKGGSSISQSLEPYDEMPHILVAMIRVGEETGELGNILDTLSEFYRGEVENAVDTLLNLIEPVLIILLGLGVGVLLASVLMPLYNITSSL